MKKNNFNLIIKPWIEVDSDKIIPDELYKLECDLDNIKQIFSHLNYKNSDNLLEYELAKALIDKIKIPTIAPQAIKFDEKQKKWFSYSPDKKTWVELKPVNNEVLLDLDLLAKYQNDFDKDFSGKIQSWIDLRDKVEKYTSERDYSNLFLLKINGLNETNVEELKNLDYFIAVNGLTRALRARKLNEANLSYLKFANNFVKQMSFLDGFDNDTWINQLKNEDFMSVLPVIYYNNLWQKWVPAIELSEKYLNGRSVDTYKLARLVKDPASFVKTRQWREFMEKPFWIEFDSNGEPSVVWHSRLENDYYNIFHNDKNGLNDMLETHCGIKVDDRAATRANAREFDKMALEKMAKLDDHPMLQKKAASTLATLDKIALFKAKFKSPEIDALLKNEPNYNKTPNNRAIVKDFVNLIYLAEPEQLDKVNEFVNLNAASIYQFDRKKAVQMLFSKDQSNINQKTVERQLER